MRKQEGNKGRRQLHPPPQGAEDSRGRRAIRGGDPREQESLGEGRVDTPPREE